jgi:hypothetical protein
MVVNSNTSNHLLCSSRAKRKACDAGLGKEESQGEATDCERAIAIALKQDLFCIADFAQLSLINKNLRGEIRQDHVWKPFLHTNRLGFGSREIVIDDSKWPDKNVPPRANHTLMIPPRIRGPRRGYSGSYFPHPKDTIALSCNVVILCSSRLDLDGITDSRFNQETGAVEDLFCSLDGLDTRNIRDVRVDELLYLPRALPVQCPTCCNASFETYPAFVKHLKSSGHIRKMTRERDEIPEEWYDPRLCDDFDTLTTFEQVSALFEFKAKVLRKLRERMDDSTVFCMDQLLEGFCDSHHCDNILDSIFVRDSALKRLIRALKEVAEDSFTHHGVKEYCLEFLKENWLSFSAYEEEESVTHIGRIVEAIKS